VVCGERRKTGKPTNGKPGALKQIGATPSPETLEAVKPHEGKIPRLRAKRGRKAAGVGRESAHALEG
jgi:hypothetical protein